MKSSNSFFKTFTVLSLITFLCFALSFGFACLAGIDAYPKSLFVDLEKHLNSKRKEVHETKSWPNQNLKNLVISTESADIEIVVHESAEIQATLNGAVDREQPMLGTISEDTLNLKVEGNRQITWKFLSETSFTASNSLKLKISIPKKLMGTIKVHSASGDVNLTALMLGSLEVNTGSGDVQIEKVSATDLNLNTGSGLIEVSGKAKLVEIKSGSGQTKLKTFSGDSLSVNSGSGEISLEEIGFVSTKAHTGSGEITARLGKIESWTTTAKTMSGDIESDFPSTRKSNHPEEMTIGTGPKQLLMESGSGDIKIRM